MLNISGLSKRRAYENIEYILNKTENKKKENFEQIKSKYSDISFDDAQIISSYTCEAKNRELSPYIILITNLVNKDRKNGIDKISKYFYIILLSLRKLPKY